MQMTRRAHLGGAIALVALNAAITPISASSAECAAADAGEESDSTCALQFRKSGGARLQAAPAQVPTWCNSTPSDVLAGSNSDNFCDGNQCCPQYGWTFPCPSASENFDHRGRCSFATIQTYPTQPLYNPVPNSLPPAAIPVPPHRAPGSYGNVVLKSGQTLEDAIKANSPAIVDVKVLQPGDQGYEQGFNSSFLDLNQEDDAYYVTNAYPGMWGDVGSVMQTGMGGVKTFNIVNITVGGDMPLKLFRLSWFKNETEGQDPRRMCSIWWGFEPTYQTDQINASRNVAICGSYDTIVRCDITGTFTFTALVGQGWDLDQYGFMERGCTEANGSNKPAYPNDFVTPALVNGSFKPPPEDVLQVVVPGCQMAEYIGSTCKACRLSDDVSEQEAVPNLAAEFEKISETKPERCTTNLEGHILPEVEFPYEPFTMDPSEHHR